MVCRKHERAGTIREMGVVREGAEILKAEQGLASW
jgi:hypothetical protein